MLAELLARQWVGEWKMEKKFRARVARVERDGRKIILCQPQTFMNDSGEAIGTLQRFYQLARTQLLVAVDDADLPLGTLRLRGEGSSGGHHGLESIEQQLGGRDYPRLRLGIGRREGDGRQIANFVLGRFAAAERETVEKTLARAAQQVECWLSAGISEAMNRFNGAADVPPPKGIK
jgi:PTH1 family peptidyl-tRNA hydrolase